MENSWQSKCGSFWQHSQPPPSLVPSSSLLHSRTQESMWLTSGMINEHMLSNMHDLDNLGHAGLGASFLSLVSGASSHLPCEQHQLDPMPVSVTNQVSSYCRNANGFCGESKVSAIPAAFLPSLTTRDAIYPLTSSSANVNCSNSSVVQATNLHFEKSQAVACHNIHEKDKAKSSSQIENNNTNSVSGNSWKLQKYAHTRSLHDNNISAYHHGFNPSSSSLRVFCSGTSGNLLLTDAGLLGVVCTCHGLYMSISKFSEHSGSCDVNPGYAVRMDNGQTLANWWKTFSKNGIRVLEGQREWDWPEGISYASGLSNHPIASMSNSPALLSQVSPLKASVSYEQQKFSILNSKENQSCKNIVDKNKIFERDRTSKECSNSIFKYFMNSFQGNLQHAAGQHQCRLPNSFTVHTEGASQSSTDKLDFICGGSANSSPALPNTQNLITPCNGRSVGTETSFVVNRPGVSSNIELRLGQARGQSQTLETKFQPAFGSELNGMHAKSSKVFFPDKLLQKTSELQGSGWTLQYADITSCTPERRGSTQQGHSCNVGGAYGAKTDCQKDPLNVSWEMTNVNSPLLSCFKNPGTKGQTTTAINSNVGEKLLCKSYASGNVKICHPSSSAAATFKGFSMNVSNAQINVNKVKEVECSLNSLLGAAKSNTEFSEAFKEDKRNFNLVSGETSSNYSSGFSEKSLNSELMPSMVVDESYGRHILSNCSKISPLSNIMRFNHDLVKPIQNSTPFKETMPMGFSSKNSVFVRNATSTLLKEKPYGIKKDLQYENVEVPSEWNMLERSNEENGLASLRSLQECETIKNPYVQSLLTIVPSISKDHSNLLDSSRMPRMPEFRERPTLSGTICWMGHNSEGFDTVTGRSLLAEDPNLPPVEQLFMRPRGPECNFTHGKNRHGSQGLPYAFVPESCSFAAQENYLEGKHALIGENCRNLVKQGDRNGADTSLLHAKLKENWKDIAKSFGKTESSVTTDVKNSELHSFQWRDVPKKIMDSCGSTRKDQQVGSHDRLVPAADVAKCFAGFALNVVPSKEQEISNISSGCSAPDVTQSSIEVSKNGSFSVEGENIKATNNLVLDEGSGNDRSWSADSALDNEYTDFFGSVSCINLTKREPSKVFPRKQSLSLIEEIRLQNSLRSKRSPYKMKKSSAILEESDNLPKFELGPTKRRKAVKWMKLDVPVLVSGQSSINNGSPKCTEEVEQSTHSFWEMQMPDGSDRRSLNICADAFLQSSKRRKSAFSAAKGIFQRKCLHKVHYQLEQLTTEAHKSSVVNDTSNRSVILSKKRLRLDDASAPCKEIQEVCCNSSELTAKLTLLGGRSSSLGNPKFFKWMTRPTVFGKYGIISNGNPSKPAKIISLRKILENESSDSGKSIRNADNNEKLTTLVKVKKMSVRDGKETILSKEVLKSQVTKGGTKNLHPIESECCGRNGDIEMASCSTTSGSDDLSYTLHKCNNHGITERKPGVQLKTKFREGRKRSLHELLTEGNGFKVVNSSVSCQTPSRCRGELMEKAVKGRAQTTEMNNAMRCSGKHQPEYSDMFCCVCGGSDKNGYSPLLQCNRFLIKGIRNEAESVDPEKVSLYGRCMCCAISQDSNNERLQPGEKFLTCARTEGYKGRKREGFLHNCPQDTDGNGGCLVPQEQLNAWLHIHRQKPKRKEHPKLSSSNVESDCRKAYARYKQSKSWKHLVVYKSRIHALGLYTSQFISRGAMVVEYVGEIVGLRVADRREKEYHSGKKIQHKSACYFFRIDKDHIIDATRKGGIARFVNHSCQPNCAAKVISVRTEKKVVFFAERDIYPGEEITYDYHFNHEDEGQKIPCYCNSQNCRRYLN